MIPQETITLRPAILEDAEILFAWRNDEETKHQSGDRGPVEREEHQDWFKRSLESTFRRIVIAENAAGEAIGTVRADMQADGSAEISYTIAPQFRGKGLSKRMVQKFVGEYLGGKKILAHIKKGHAPSESVARALGLAPVSEEPSHDEGDDRPMVEWR